MTKPPLLYCATDKELYDALSSAKQQFTQTSLLDLARQRGIFYSPDSPREQLVNDLSLQIFGLAGVSAIQDVFERSGRGEKTSSMRLNAALSMEDLKKAASAIAGDFAVEGDRVISYAEGNSLSVDVKYEELDLSRTRLRQRQKREAKIAVRVESDHAIVTFPSTEKARLVAQNLVGRAVQEAQVPVAIEEIDLSSVSDHSLRTSFFQRLVTEIEGFSLEDVVKVKVDYNPSFAASNDADPTLSADLQDDLEEEATQEMLSVVRAMILHGQSLLASSEYRSLRNKGFFLTSIQWSSRREIVPNEIVEFDAGFEDPIAGVDFKYNVRGWKTRRPSGEYTQTFVTVPTAYRKGLLQLLEATATRVSRELKQAYTSTSEVLS